MSSTSSGRKLAQPTGELAIRELFQQLLNRWNSRDAKAYALLFELDGFAVGFDGSPHLGRSQIESEVGQIFAQQQTGRFVGKIREARMLTADVAILRAVAGVVPPGESDIKPETIAIQTVVATQREGQWLIAVFQNTPAQFHGRPKLAKELTEELGRLI